LIHFAIGLFVLSLTCAALTLVAWFLPAAPGVSLSFACGSAAAFTASSLLLLAV